jgi:hypothetical protein
MIREIRKKFEIFLAILFINFLPSSIVADNLTQNEKHTLALSYFCVQTLLDPEQIRLVVTSFEKHKPLEESFIARGAPNADFGYGLMFNDHLYFVFYGSRQSKLGGPFCSVMTDGLTYADAKLIVKESFTTFKKHSEQKYGMSKMAVYVGLVPGYSKDVGLSIQNEFSMNSFSIYFAD